MRGFRAMSLFFGQACEPGDQLHGQLARARGDVDVTRAIGKLNQQPITFFRIAKGMFGQNGLPMFGRDFERGRFGRFPASEQLPHIGADVASVAETALELFAVFKAHRRRQTLLRLG